MSYSSRLSDIGEKKVIEILLEYVDKTNSGLERDDDVALIRDIALKIDGFSIYDSMLPWNNFYDMGWKASTMIASDFIAKGVKPIAIMASIGMPRDIQVNVVIDIVRGLRDSAHNYDALFVGGDTNASRTDIWIDASGIGLPIDKVISIRGAKRGDYIGVTGWYGLTGAAFHAYSINYEPALLEKKYPEIVKSTKRPEAPLYFLEIVKKYRPCITSSTDISDGLAFSLGRLATKNKVAMYLEHIPIHAEALRYAREVNMEPLTLALYGGEEFEVLFTIDEECNNIIDELEKNYNIFIIGVVGEGEGVYYDNKRINPLGWDHFRNRLAGE